MKFKLHHLFILLGIGILIMIFKSRSSEDLVTETDSAPISTFNFDAKIAKIPFETATFGMG